jgi:hypothetical protein
MSNVIIRRVSAGEDLQSILYSTTGPAVIEMEAFDYGSVTLYGRNYGEGVVVRSVAEEGETVLSSIKLTSVERLSFEGITVDFVAQDGKTGPRAVTIKDSSDIAFRHVTFDGDIATGVDEESNGKPTGSGIFVTSSTNVNIEDSTFFTWYRGGYFQNVDGLTLSGNEFYGMRCDGIDLTAVQGVVIENNYFHDFISNGNASGTRDHRDFIQFWSTGADRPSTDVMIRNNLLDIGAGDWTQSIFIRKEMVDGGSTGEEMFYRDFLIEGNVIRNSHSHGITVGETIGLTIQDNTLLRGTGPDGQNYGAPRINVSATSQDVAITGNVLANEPLSQEGWIVENNTIDAAASHSALTRGETLTGDKSLFLFTAPEGGEGLAHEWDFGDGAVGEGQTALHDYAEPGMYVAVLRSRAADGTLVEELRLRVNVAEVTELRIELRNGLMVDATPEGALLSNEKLALMTDFTETGPALRLSAEHELLAFDRYNGPDVFEQAELSLSFRIRADLAGDADGTLFMVWGGMDLSITETGEASMKLPTSEGSAITLTDGAGLLDGEWHDVFVIYSDEQDNLSIHIDGDELASVDLSGLTQPEKYWAPHLGGRWGDDGFEGWISDIVIHEEAIDSHYDLL